jgi:prepilin-type N-terminal cleavage/methylation domain-containing protein
MQGSDQARHSAGRRGFTLVEVMVVIVIMLVLVSLTAGVVSKGFAWVYRTNTEKTMQKIDQRVQRVFEKIRKNVEANDPPAGVNIRADVPIDLWTLADDGTGNPDIIRKRAKVLFYKLQTNHLFPANYREVVLNAQLWSNNPYVASIHQKLSTKVGSRWPYWGDPNPPPPASIDQAVAQNSAILAVMYELQGSLDDLTSAEVQDTNLPGAPADGAPEICDGWGTPIVFFRWGNVTGGPAPAAPFAHPLLRGRAMQAFPAKFASAAAARDSDDPEGLLRNNPNVPAANYWRNWASNLTNFQAAFGYTLEEPPIYAPFVLISAGPNRIFGDDDDIDSYRLRLGLTQVQ